MAGEITVLRFFIAQNGDVQFQKMTDDKEFDRWALIGALEIAKQVIVESCSDNQSTYRKMSDKKVDDIRELLDN